MEETIGYEALFSPEEWDSLSFGDWLDDIDPDDDMISSGVATDGSGRAAQGQEVASEGNNSHSVGLSLDARVATSCNKSQDQKSEQDPMLLEFVHEVSCRTRELDDGTTEYVVECELCDEIGSAETLEEAQAIARLHEAFVARLVDRYEVA